jgi:hypothetical protein
VVNELHHEIERVSVLVAAKQISGDLSGVFEYDGETAYFYLYAETGFSEPTILAAVHIQSGPINLERNEISVFWDDSNRVVSLSINGEVRAQLSSAIGKN